MDLVSDRELAETILDIPFHYHLTAAKKLTEIGVDMVWVGDDIGAQNSMIVSPDMWRSIFKPRWTSVLIRGQIDQSQSQDRL